MFVEEKRRKWRRGSPREEASSEHLFLPLVPFKIFDGSAKIVLFLCVTVVARAEYRLALWGDPREDMVSDNGWVKCGCEGWGWLVWLSVSFRTRKVLCVV